MLKLFIVITFLGPVFHLSQAFMKRNAERKYENLVNEVLFNFQDFSNDLLKIRTEQRNASKNLERLEKEQEVNYQNLKSEILEIKKTFNQLAETLPFAAKANPSMVPTIEIPDATTSRPTIYGGCDTVNFQQFRKEKEQFESMNPVVGGADWHNATLYICRANWKGETFIGKVSLYSGGLCYIAYPTDGKEHRLGNKEFQILTNPGHANLKWVQVIPNLFNAYPTSTRNSVNGIPSNSIVVGNKSNGQPMYVGRCNLKTYGWPSLIPGTLLPENTALLVPFASLAHNCSSYEALVCED